MTSQANIRVHHRGDQQDRIVDLSLPYDEKTLSKTVETAALAAAAGLPALTKTPDGQPHDVINAEYLDLGGGKEIMLDQAEKELAELGAEWRLQTPHELFSQVDYDHKNKNGAYTRDSSIKAGWYWTNQAAPWSPEFRMVVYFSYGSVNVLPRSSTAFARAVLIKERKRVP